MQSSVDKDLQIVFKPEVAVTLLNGGNGEWLLRPKADIQIFIIPKERRAAVVQRGRAADNINETRRPECLAPSLLVQMTVNT